MPRACWGALPPAVDVEALAGDLSREAAARALPPDVDVERLARDLSQEAARRSGQGPELSEELMGELAEDLPPPGLRGETCDLACFLGSGGDFAADAPGPERGDEAKFPAQVSCVATPGSPMKVLARWAFRRFVGYVGEVPGWDAAEWQL